MAGYSNPGMSQGGVQNQPFAGESFRPQAYQDQVYADFYGPGAVMDGSTGQYITDSGGNVVGKHQQVLAQNLQLLPIQVQEQQQTH